MLPGTVQPDIYQYMDYRHFIRDMLAHLQEKNAKYSQRWLAKRSGLTPQLLSMILKGKRNLSTEKTPTLAQSLHLSGRACEYFQLLVQLNQADGEETQRQVLRQIDTSFRGGLFKEMQGEKLGILRHWYLPAIREMVALDTFQPDPQWIADCLAITPIEAEQALTLLVELGYLAHDSSSPPKYVRTEPSFHTPNGLYPMVVSHYNLQILERAFLAHRLPRDKRHFESLTCAIPAELFETFGEKIEQFFRELDAMAEEQTQRTDVIQVNLQMFAYTPMIRRAT